MVVGGPVARKPVPMVVALLVTLALMLAPAAQQEARAKGSGPGDDPKPGQGKCFRAAKKAGLIGPELNRSNTTFISGTNGDDRRYEDEPVAADEVFCGFGGRDVLSEADNFGVVLGGPGNDYVSYNRGTFKGGQGNDGVEGNSGTFNGGKGDDSIWENIGIFNGGKGNDGIIDQIDHPDYNAIFNGGPGCDTVSNNEGGTVDLGDQSGCPA